MSIFDLDASGTVKWDSDLTRNIYGCYPCPKCGGNHRAAYKKTMTVDCDDCGFVEPAIFVDDLRSGDLAKEMVLVFLRGDPEPE